jgi:predicted metal-dependent hydrolase
LRGVSLFNAGYYWEAHEVWESLWHAHGRHGPIADILKALIKLAAAGVKVREGQQHGVVVHARRAQRLFEDVRRTDRSSLRLLGLDLGGWEKIAGELADDPPTPVNRLTFVFAFRVDPR